MLIFLAGLAFLIMLMAVGQDASARLWHGRPNVLVPHATTTHPPRWRSAPIVAVCAGFIVAVALLMLIGVVPPP